MVTWKIYSLVALRSVRFIGQQDAVQYNWSVSHMVSIPSDNINTF